jgi:hypothetical protein
MMMMMMMMMMADDDDDDDDDADYRKLRGNVLHPFFIFTFVAEGL